MGNKEFDKWANEHNYNSALCCSEKMASGMPLALKHISMQLNEKRHERGYS